MQIQTYRSQNFLLHNHSYNGPKTLETLWYGECDSDEGMGAINKKLV